MVPEVCRCEAGEVAEPGTYWHDVYAHTPITDVSWFQPNPAASIELIRETGARADSPIVDVGGGASTLADRLLDEGYRDVTVLDVADNGLASARSRLGQRAGQVRWILADLLRWQPNRRYHVWHDRAVFHFLTAPADRQRYRSVLSRALEPGGHIVIGTFAADGPTRCSGLPTARYSTDTLAAELPGYRVLHQRREEHVTPSDNVQPFTWLVLAHDTNAFPHIGS
jgi:SAM-dependent methyltransferase